MPLIKFPPISTNFPTPLPKAFTRLAIIFGTALISPRIIFGIFLTSSTTRVMQPSMSCGRALSRPSIMAIIMSGIDSIKPKMISGKWVTN